jgi:hypothetical protein
MIKIAGCLLALATLLVGCTVVDPRTGVATTVVPVSGVDAFGNPTLNWVPLAQAGLVVPAGPDDYDYDVDPVVYPDDVDVVYLQSHGYYWHHGHYHRWHGGGPRLAQDRNGHIFHTRGAVAHAGFHPGAVRRAPVTFRKK